MKILVVGGGGREHAIIKKLKENQSVETIYALPGNGGMAEDAVCVPIGATDIGKIVDFAVENQIDYAVVAPDDPLVLGAVDALNGAPGVYSARYAGEHGNDAANNEKLMAEMQNVPVGQRAAKFVSAVCLILPDGRELVVTGECPGSVALTPAGDNGFGYDPLFVPDAVGLPGGGTVPNTAHRTYAELADAEKDAISHRGRAMEKLEAELAAFLGE